MDGQTRANQQASQKSGEGIKQTTVMTHNGISKLQYYHRLANANVVNVSHLNFKSIIVCSEITITI